MTFVSFTTSDWIAIGIGAIAIIAAVIIGYIQIRVARQLAQPPGVELSLGHFQLGRRRPVHIVYGTSWPDDQQRAMILRILVKNNGKRAAEHVKVGIVLPAGANQSWEHASFSPDRGIVPGIISRAVRIGELVQSDLYFPLLSPGEVGAFDQPFWLPNNTEITRDINTKTKDGVGVHFSATFAFSLKFEVMLHTKEEEPIVDSVYVEAFPATNVDELVAAVIRAEKARNNDGSTGTFKPYLSRLSEWLFPPVREFLLTIPEFRPSPTVGNSDAGFEDLNKSQRWLLAKRRKWSLREVEWNFH